MPERTVTIYTCSNCSKDIDGEVESFEVAYPNGARLRFDLCNSCAVETQPLLAKGEPVTRKSSPFGRRAAAPLVGTGETFKCPDCDYTHTRAQSVAVHRSRVHGYKSSRKR